MKLLDGYSAVVTGAGGNLGAAAARGFFEAGCRVVVADIRAEHAAATARAIDPEGRRVTSVACDVTRAEDCAALVAAAERFFGAPIDVFHAHAGVGFAGDLRTVDPAAIKRTIDVNVTGSLFSAQAALPSLVKSKNASLLFTSSLQSVATRPQRSAYTASKHAIAGIVKALAVEFGPLGVRVNAVAPSSIDGEFLRNQLANVGTTDLDAAVARVAAGVPLGRLPTPEDFAHALVFLASPLARSISGINMLLDSGAAAGAPAR